MEVTMKEQLYTIPVNDAFNQPCECPLCKIYDNLEQESIDFMLGPSYMEDDIRMETNKTGFCTKHINNSTTDKTVLVSLLCCIHI